MKKLSKEDKMTDKTEKNKDKTDAGCSEMHMDTDLVETRNKGETQLEREIITDVREKDGKENNKDINFREVIFVNVGGKLVKKDRRLRNEEIEKEMANKYFEPGLKGYKVVCCKLTRENMCVKKGLNRVKIQSLLHNIGCTPDYFEMDRFNLARLKFRKDEDANSCIERLNTRYKDKIQVYIDNRSRFCKGVIADWPYSIEELWENLGKKDNILQLEVMKKRIYNREEKKLEIKETNNIIITVKGNKLPEKFTIFEGFGNLRVRPYVESVSQCFRCFKYGHFQNNCKSNDLCGRCGNTAHGPCGFEFKCVNCGGRHRATDKKCPVYIKNKEIKKVMAYHSASYTEAMKIINGQDTEEREYDKYNKKTWPTIDERLRSKILGNRENFEETSYRRENSENNEKRTYARVATNPGIAKKEEYYNRTLNKIKENEYDRKMLARSRETESSNLSSRKDRMREENTKRNKEEESERETRDERIVNKQQYQNIKEVLEEEDWKKFIRDQIKKVVQEEVERTIGIKSTVTEDETEEIYTEGETYNNLNAQKRQRYQ
ncbi:uncharacterized protein [Temnothorax nylanderi]|uniref:uncharacterized protein n=1 Tax=Temnothorax nylanderi TaxID=102681 RepID=UPI003A89E6E2